MFSIAVFESRCVAWEAFLLTCLHAWKSSSMSLWIKGSEIFAVPGLRKLKALHVPQRANLRVFFFHPECFILWNEGLILCSPVGFIRAVIITERDKKGEMKGLGFTPDFISHKWGLLKKQCGSMWCVCITDDREIVGFPISAQKMRVWTLTSGLLTCSWSLDLAWLGRLLFPCWEQTKFLPPTRTFWRAGAGRSPFIWFAADSA